MNHRMRSAVLAVTAAATFVALPVAIAAVAPAPANADVCGNVGRRISVGGCVDIAGAIADYAPPPSEYAPMPEDFTPNASACVGWNGRWVSANGCTP